MLHKNKKNVYTISIWEDSFDFMIKKLTFTMAAMLSEQSEFYYSGVQRKKGNAANICAWFTLEPMSVLLINQTHSVQNNKAIWAELKSHLCSTYAYMHVLV